MKKLVFLIALFLVFAFESKSQDSTQKRPPIVKYLIKADPTEDELHFQPPQFPGGPAMFEKYINSNAAKSLKPDHAFGAVKVKMWIDKNGKVTSVKIIKGLTPEIDSVAVYLLRKGPLWKPGQKNGIAKNTVGEISVKFIDPKIAQPLHVQDVQLSKGNNADVTIDEPVASPKVTEEVDPNYIFTSVEKQPEFPGGFVKFLQFIKDNQKVNVGTDAKSGRVIVSFVVEKDGALTGIKVVRSISVEYDAEALRLLKLMPKWLPGMQNGRPVRVQYSVPINLGLN